MVKTGNGDIGGNIGKYSNKIVSVPNGSFETNFAGATILTQNWHPANEFFGYTTNGIFSTTAEATAAGLKKKNTDGSYSSFAAGDVRFVDVNGDKIIDASDRKIIGNPNPDSLVGLAAGLFTSILN